MNKKAFAIVNLVMGIIILAAIVFFLVYLGTVGFQSHRAAIDSECQSSIVAHAALVKTAGGDLAPTVYCPTKYYTISSKNDEKIRNFMAEELRTCWGTWGKGRLELFSGDGFYCHVCSVVDFKGDQRQVTGLLHYLANTNIPSGDGNGMTYMQYLASHSTTDVDPELDSAVKAQQYPDSMDTDKKYAVIFAYARGEEAIKEFLDKAGSVVGGGVAGGAAGAAVGGIVVVATHVATLGVVAASGGTVLVIAGIGAGVGAVIGWLSSNDIEWASVATVEEFNATHLKEMGCQISDVKQDRQQDTLG